MALQASVDFPDLFLTGHFPKIIRPVQKANLQMGVQTPLQRVFKQLQISKTVQILPPALLHNRVTFVST